MLSLRTSRLPLFKRVLATRHAAYAAMSQDTQSPRRERSSSPSSLKRSPSSSAPSPSVYSYPRDLLVVFRENAASAVKRLPRWTTPLLSIFGGAVGFWLAGASLIVGVGSSLITGALVVSLRFGAGDKPEFLTPLFEECVEDVRKLLTVLEQKLQEEYRASKYPLFVNLMLLKLHQTREQNGNNPPPPPSSSEMISLSNPSSLHSSAVANVITIDPSPVPAQLDDDADAYLQYAASAYGTAMNPDLITTVYSPKTLIFHQEDIFDDSTQATANADENWGKIISKRVIVQLTGLSDAAIKVVELEGETALMPRYFIAVDERRKTVVLCIRGTLSLSDILTDVCAESVPFVELGVAHQGICAGAIRLKEETTETLNSLLAENPGFSLVVCGHSLGAGTASLLTMSLLYDQDHFRLPLPLQTSEICAYCYAPPPTFGPLASIPIHWNARIHSFINGADVVPKLSLSSVYRLLKDLLAIDRCDITLTERFQLIVKCLQKDEDSFHRLDRLVDAVMKGPSTKTKKCVGHDKEKGHREEFPDLFVTGKVMWINRGGKEGENGKCEVLRADQVESDGIKILENFIADHFPSSYRKSFKEIRDGLKAKF